MGGKWIVWTSMIVVTVAFSSRGIALAQLTPEKSAAAKENKPAATTKKFTVWVYKLEGGAWVRQSDRTLETNDEEQARRYVDSVKSVSGWTATWNLPSPISLASAAPVPIYPGSLEGTTWKSSRTGYIRFAAGGVLLESATGKGSFTPIGCWAMNDCAVTLQFSGRPLQYPLGVVPASFTGYLNGGRIVGTWVAYNWPVNSWGDMYTRFEQ